MASQMKAEIYAIDEIRKNIGTCFAQIGKTQRSLLAHVDALAKAWEGEAHAEFQGGFRNECMNLDSLQKEGLALCGFEKNAVDVYSSAEMEVGEKVRTI